MKDIIDEYIRETSYEQLSKEELGYMLKFIDGKKLNMLVFGVGADSHIWNSMVNVVFLEHDEVWASKYDFDIRKVEYNTHAKDWRKLIDKGIGLRLVLPRGIEDRKWDIIFIDAPNGLKEGRMKSIYTASMLGHRHCKTDIFVHDCEREIEKAYCDKYMNFKLIKQIRKLRHYKT